MLKITAFRGATMIDNDRDNRAHRDVAIVDAGAVLKALLDRNAGLESIIADLQAAADAGSRTALEKLRSPWGTSTAASRKAPGINRKLAELAATLPEELAHAVGNAVLYLILLEQKKDLERQRRPERTAAGDIHMAFAQRLVENNVTERHLLRISKEREAEVFEFIKECADAPRSSTDAILEALTRAGLRERVSPAWSIRDDDANGVMPVDESERLNEITPKGIWDEVVGSSGWQQQDIVASADVQLAPEPNGREHEVDPIRPIRFAPPRLPRGFKVKQEWMHPVFWEALGPGVDHIPFDREANAFEARQFWQENLPSYGSIELLRSNEPAFDDALNEADDDVRELHQFRRDLIDRYALNEEQLVEELRCDDRFAWAEPFLPDAVWLDHEAFRVWRDYAGLCSAAQRFNPMLGTCKSGPSAQSWAYLLRGRWKRFRKPGERLVGEALFDYLLLPLHTANPLAVRYLIPREIMQGDPKQADQDFG